MKYKIMAYITAYEDKQAILKCIQSLKNQSYRIHEIFIIDNSKVPLISLSEELDEGITIETHSENIGISGGLKIGIQHAISNKFDFIWTFDQDSEAYHDSLETLLNYYDQLTQAGKSVGVIAPLPVDQITGQKWHGIVFDKYKFVEAPECESSQAVYECDVVITSGSLVSISAARKTPLPREEYFIDAVDWEYCMKIRDCNYNIFVVKNIFLKHRFGNSHLAKAIIRKRNVTIYNYIPLRYYYMCRNHTFLETRLAFKKKHILKSLKRRLEFLVIMLAKIVLYEKNSKLLKIWACIKGTTDGLTGKLGKTWD
jgi:rhamnosyltransferase